MNAVAKEEGNAMMRREREKDLRFLNDVIDAEPRHREKPNDHHRAKKLADVAGSAPLDHEESE